MENQNYLSPFLVSENLCETEVAEWALFKITAADCLGLHFSFLSLQGLLEPPIVISH